MPPAADVNVLMKKLSPPSTERFRPPSMPPREAVAISTPPLIAAIAPASTSTDPPGGSVIVPNANAGPDWISTCIGASSDRFRPG